MEGYKPTIYLRNIFRMKWDSRKTYLNMFINGKEQFIKQTRSKGWSLVAAFAEWPLAKGEHVIQPECEMIQIWKLDNWDTLYDTMQDLSETSWYRELGRSLASEDQNLLINAAMLDPAPKLRWHQENDPDYLYVYEESRPVEGCNHAYIREVNWFSAVMAERAGWELVWLATQVTEQPAKVSVLWRARGASAKSIPQDLSKIAQSERYNEKMLTKLQAMQCRILYPIYTERLAELAAGPAPKA